MTDATEHRAATWKWSDEKCQATVTLRNDEHRAFVCLLAKGHSGEHVGPNVIWTDGETHE